MWESAASAPCFTVLANSKRGDYLDTEFGGEVVGKNGKDEDA